MTFLFSSGRPFNTTLTFQNESSTLLDVAKTPRTEIVGVRFTPEERGQVEELAERMGNASLSDCIRSATKMYAKLRLNPQRFTQYLMPFLIELVKTGEIREMDLAPEEPRPPRRRR